MTLSSSVYYSAIGAGDAAATATYFARAAVRANVARTESLVRRESVTDRRLLPSPWFLTGVTQAEIIFRCPILRGHVDLMQWFMSPPQLDATRSTLAMLFPELLHLAVQANHSEMLEFLLSAALAIVPPERLQEVLNDVLRNGHGSDRVSSLLLAHGADIDAFPLQYATSTQHVDNLAADGACVVGSVVRVNRRIPVDAVRGLLTQGADLATDTRWLWLTATSHNIQLLKLLHDSFADADARDDRNGRTLAMLAIAKQDRLGEFASPSMQCVQLLLNYGASLDARDVRGWTLVHQAAFYNAPDILALLLKRGADPNALTSNEKLLNPSDRWLPVDCLLDDNTPIETVSESLAVLLLHGADPHAIGRNRQTLHLRLITTDTGRAFLSPHGLSF